MAHFVKVEGGIVTNVIVADDDFSDESDGWIKTQKYTRGGVHYGPDGKPDGEEELRKNYAGIGHTYDETRDAFYESKPFNSWVLNEDTCDWEPPTAYPDDGKDYKWDEDTTSWKERT